MSSQDVIELGSSDEECEASAPARAVVKKAKKRPMVNAMVHIPSIVPNMGKSKKWPNPMGSSKVGAITVKSNKALGLINGSKLPDVTIKPIRRPLALPTNIPIKGLLSVKNPFARKANGTNPLISKNNRIPAQVPPKVMKHPVLIKNRQVPKTAPVNYLGPSLSNLMQKMSPQAKMALESKMTPQQKLALQQKKTPHKGPLNLPPGITITKKSAQPDLLKRSFTATKPNANPKKRIRLQPPVTVETVELDADDDDDNQPGTSSSAVSWYVRPEDDLKTQNEEEPEPPKILEITIEDSPIKPIQNKRTWEIETSIAIDDSPVKPPDDNGKDKEVAALSDDESPKTLKTPSSRKMLKYNEPQACNEEIIEIEIEPYCSDPISDRVVEKHQEEQEHIVIEIQESPVRKRRKLSPDVTPKKSKPANTDKPARKEKTTLTINDEYKDFHPVYKSFIELCFKLDDTEDMKTIAEKKIKSYYLQVPKSYRESEEFIELVSGKMDLMKASPDKMFLFIKDVVDELNVQRKLAKMPSYAKERKTEDPESPPGFEESELDVKRRRQIRKLEKTLQKLHRAINKLEEQEVDFDDDGDSVYILTERYKERLIRVHAKLCQLSNVKMPSEPRVTIDVRPGHPTGPAKRLEKWINRRVPMGTPLPFPDFHDVLRCVKQANKEDDLGWNDVDVMEQARDLFTRCGKKLQRRRQENEWRVAMSRMNADPDPAELSDDLKRKLDDNRRAALSKETDLINKYADRQKQLKLEAVEIGDKEAEESPVESEDEANDDGDNDANLENSQERKERLKRLLKTKHTDNGKSNEQNKDVLEADVILSDLPARKSPAKVNVEDSNEEQPKNKNATPTDHNVFNIAKDIEMDVDEGENNLKTIEDKSETEEKTNDEGKHVTLKTKDRQQSVETLSDDDTQKIDSDIDELHLLQKLHSDANTTDSDSLIAISDSMESGDEKEKKNCSDVVSIENSSSESEQEKEDDNEEVEIQIEPDIEEKEEQITVDIDCYTEKESKTDIRTEDTSKDCHNAPFGEVLLKSSRKSANEANSDNYTNMRDDDLSIGDTEVEESRNKKKAKVEDSKTSDKTNQLKKVEITDNNQTEKVVNTIEVNDLNEQERGAVSPIDCNQDEDKVEQTAVEIDCNDKQKSITDNQSIEESKDNHRSPLGEVLIGSSCKSSNETNADNDIIMKDNALSFGDTEVEMSINKKEAKVKDSKTSYKTNQLKEFEITDNNQTEKVINAIEVSIVNDLKRQESGAASPIDCNQDEEKVKQTAVEINCNDKQKSMTHNLTTEESRDNHHSTLSEVLIGPSCKSSNETNADNDIIMEGDALSIGDTEVQESIKKKEAKEETSKTSDKTNQLKEVESSTDNQTKAVINTIEVSKLNDLIQQESGAVSHIDCKKDEGKEKQTAVETGSNDEENSETDSRTMEDRRNYHYSPLGDILLGSSSDNSNEAMANYAYLKDDSLFIDDDTEFEEIMNKKKSEVNSSSESGDSNNKDLNEVECSSDTKSAKVINTSEVSKANKLVQPESCADSAIDCDKHNLNVIKENETA